MKSILTILLVTLSSGFALANTSNSTEALDNEPIESVEGNEGDDAAVVVSSEPLDQKPSISEHEKDSSEYSVNKFNYLFYLIYKVKYLGFDEDLEHELTIE